MSAIILTENVTVYQENATKKQLAFTLMYLTILVQNRTKIGLGCRILQKLQEVLSLLFGGEQTPGS